MTEEARQARFENRMGSIDSLMQHGRQFIESEQDEILNKIDTPKLFRMANFALSQIDEPDREIFELHVQGFVQTEIGERTHRDQSFVSRSIKRTRRKILLYMKHA